MSRAGFDGQPCAWRGECSIRSQRVELVQRAVEDLYGKVVLSAQAQTGVRGAMKDYCGEFERSSRAELARTNALLGGLKERERTLLHARFRSGLSEEVFTEELAQIQREREQIERVLRHLDASASELEETLDMALRLLGGGLQQAYVRADDQTRRFFNQALFQGLWIDDEAVEWRVLEQPFYEIVTASNRAARKPRRRPARGEAKSKSGPESGEPGSEPLALDGLSKHRMVGLARLLSDIRTVARLEKLAGKVDRLAAATPPVSRNQAATSAAGPSRQGEIRLAVSAAMLQAAAALTVGEVHALVEARLGRPVVRTSVLSQLWGHAEGRGRDEFVLVSKGVYRRRGA